MNIAIVTPSRRFWNLPALKLSIEKAMLACPEMAVTWVIVLEQEQFKALPHELAEALDLPWIKTVIIQPQGDWDGCYLKLNAGLDYLSAFDGFVWFVADDSLIGRTSLQRIAQANSRIVVFSAHRGNQKTYHGAEKLLAHPDNMRGGSVTGEQLIVDNVFFKRPLRYKNHSGADGFMAEFLWKWHSAEFGFVSGYHVLFNALEPKRWESSELQRMLAL